jgi:hypothetical protein
MSTFTLQDRRTGDVTFAGVPVHRSRPCPICGKPDWCLRDYARGLTICPRTPSARQIGDAGYLHADHGVPVSVARVVLHSRPVPRPFIDFAPMGGRFAACAKGDDLQRLAESLAVSVESLARLGTGWSVGNNAWTFPMRDARMRIVGVRFRASDGAKFALTGSANALFIPEGLTGEGSLCIEEGPTSTAAVLDWGLDCIGRPSCSSCVDMTLEWVMDHARGARRNVVIIANNDTAKVRADGSRFFPGQEGAGRLAAALHPHVRSVKVVLPLAGKDSREWKTAGGTRRSLDFAINTVTYWRPA